VAQRGSPARESGPGGSAPGDSATGGSAPGDSGGGGDGPDGSAGRQAVPGSRLARRRRVLLGVGIAAALLAIGGLIGASFVKSPQQLAADTAPPPPTVTTAAVVSQVLTSSVQMRGVVYPATQYDVYASAPASSPASAAGPAAGGSSASTGSSAAAGSGAVYISRLDVAAATPSAMAGNSPRSTVSRCSH
jgi:hypothetical protein